MGKDGKRIYNILKEYSTCNVLGYRIISKRKIVKKKILLLLTNKDGIILYCFTDLYKIMYSLSVRNKLGYYLKSLSNSILGH